MTDKTTDTFRSAMRTVLDMAPEAPDMPQVDKPQHDRWPILAAASGFAAVIVVLGFGTAALMRGGDEAQSDVTNSSPLAAATLTTTTPTTQAGLTTVTVVPVLAWQRIDPDGPSEAGNLISGGPGYLHAASICTTVDSIVCAKEQPAIWGSTDGVAWDRVAQDTLVDGSIRDITSGPAGFVAVGIGEHRGGFDAGRVWISPDGTTWSAVPDPDEVFVGSGFTVVESVTAGGPGYVVVGWENPGGPDTNAVVWLSQDGSAWDRVTDPELLGDPASGDSADMIDVVSGGPGFVAYGSAVWISIDGTEWDRVADVEFTLVTVNPTSGRLLGFTPKGPDGQHEVWVSDDGMQWTHVGTLPEAPGNISATAWDRNTLVVVVGDEEPDAVWSVWMSTNDGITWSRADTDELQPQAGSIIEIASATFDGSRFIISGAECDSTADNCQSVIWIGT